MSFRATLAKLKARVDEKLKPRPSRVYASYREFLSALARGEISREEFVLHKPAYQQFARMAGALILGPEHASDGLAHARRHGLTDAEIGALEEWARAEGLAGSVAVEVATRREDHDRRCVITRRVTIARKS